MLLLQQSFTALHLIYTRLGKVVFLCTQEMGTMRGACSISFATAPGTGFCFGDIKEASGAGEPRMREFPHLVGGPGIGF